jgi:hypothetical protein
LEETIFGHELPMQLTLEFPFSGVKENGNPYAFGIGLAAIGLNLNFYHDESTGVSLSVYPQLEFAPHGSVEKGLADSGQTLVLPFLAMKELTYATFVLNAGIEQPFHDRDRRTTGMLALGLGRAIMRKLALMGEIHGESQCDFKTARTVNVNLGVMYGVRHVPIYVRIGRSLSSADGSHTYVAVGGKVVLSPDRQ